MYGPASKVSGKWVGNDLHPRGRIENTFFDVEIRGGRKKDKVEKEG